MFKIMSIANIERFLETVEQCQGGVTLHLPNRTSCELKNNELVQQLLKLGCHNRDGMYLSLECPGDFPAFLQYMMEAACC